ncbi:hypothetical protein C8R43DRAFT_999667 [Mycena crocata]|nr:hypothetical protein C8R43DRAFT_999667 [Mycena crocata]
MNRSINAQRSGSQSPPVTSPRRTARSPFTPNNNPASRPNVETLLHRHRIPIRRRQQNTLPPNALSLAQASARLVQERLQQHQNRLQVQLQARPAPSSPVPVVSVKEFLDTSFRAYASRIQLEFNNLRAQCARAVQHEQHQTAGILNACAHLAHERDVAQEKYRVLLERRARAGKRTRTQVESEEAAADLEATGLLYPLSPVSPPQLPTQSPPPRLLSPFMLAARRNPSHTPDPEDTTGFDLTVSCDSLSRPTKKRRVSDSSECTLVPPGVEENAAKPATRDRETCPPAPVGFGECDMDLESESESDYESAINVSKSKSRSSLRAASSPPAKSQTCQNQSLTPPPSACADKVHLDVEYVDIMYLPTDGKLVCRVCLCVCCLTSLGLHSHSFFLRLAATSTKHSTRPSQIKAFVPGAAWDILRAHCEESHPDACRDVIGLGKVGVQELRRRMGLQMPMPP